MKSIFYKIFIFISYSFYALNTTAQYTTNFYPTEVNNEELSATINMNVSDLISAFNVAQFNKTAPNLSILDGAITDLAKEHIMKLWEDCPFACMEEEWVSAANKQPNGDLQFRDIPLSMKPLDPNKGSWKKYQQAVVTVDSTGCITNFHLAINPDLYIKMMQSGRTVEDVERRLLILEYVERFRNAYNMKDMNFLQQIYSDDALIITGKVIKKADTDGKVVLSSNKVEYKKQTKQEYLDNLQKVFNQNKRINVIFDDIELKKHPIDKNYYGITLKQGWSSDKYSDVGWLFLLWDFTNPDEPKIHVRTWQATEIQGEKVEFNEADKFSIEDFSVGDDE